MAKDFRNIEYHISPDGEENGVRYYACSILNTKKKELIFNQKKGAIVQIRWEVHVGKGIENLSETFNFTPQFGEFVFYGSNLFKYVLKKGAVEKSDVTKYGGLKYINIPNVVNDICDP